MEIRELKILGRTYRVIEDENLIADSGNRGEFRPRGREIVVAPSLHPDETVRTLLHEALHAAFYSIENPFATDAQEEAVIQLLQTAIPSLLRDNPKFAMLLIEEQEGGDNE
jgi:hypothetical protein